MAALQSLSPGCCQVRVPLQTTTVSHFAISPIVHWTHILPERHTLIVFPASSEVLQHFQAANRAASGSTLSCHQCRRTIRESELSLRCSAGFAVALVPLSYQMCHFQNVNENKGALHHPDGLGRGREGMRRQLSGVHLVTKVGSQGLWLGVIPQSSVVVVLIK